MSHGKCTDYRDCDSERCAIVALNMQGIYGDVQYRCNEANFLNFGFSSIYLAVLVFDHQVSD